MLNFNDYNQQLQSNYYINNIQLNSIQNTIIEKVSKKIFKRDFIKVFIELIIKLLKLGANIHSIVKKVKIINENQQLNNKQYAININD